MIDLSAVDVEDLVIRLGLSNARLTSSGSEVNFSCFGPEHSHGDESPSAYINVDTTAGFCHGCKRRWNAISLVMEVQEVSKPTAERALREWYGIEFDEPVGGSMVNETESRFREITVKPAHTPPPRSWLSGVRVDWDSEYDPEPFERYMLERGFMPSTLADWDIGYDYLSDRLTIPVFDVHGELVGVKARDWTGVNHPKYRILGDLQFPRYGFEPYESSDVVFGLHRAREYRTACLVEGELNAIALAQIGVPRPVATGMSYFSERHAHLLVREVDEVVVYYDHGAAGHDGVWGHVSARGQSAPGVVAALEPHVRVRVVDPGPEDPADLLRLGRGQEALDLIAGAPSSLSSSLVFR